MRTALPVAVPLLGLCLFAGVGDAATDGHRCAAAKLRAASKKAQGLLTCHATAVSRGASVETTCLDRVKAKFATKWAKIEANGGCATVGDVDSIESHVDAFVDLLVAAVPASTTTTTTTTSTTSITSTSTTTTPSTSCPPPTAFYCGITQGGTGVCPGGTGFPIFCPSGMTCQTSGSSCTCVGDPVPCGNIRAPLCLYGSCPTGKICRSDPGSGTCPPTCGCQ
jgi:hypothetical protein